MSALERLDKKAWSDVPERIRPAVREYLQLLEAWNRRVDLVAPAAQDVWLARHIVDSLTFVTLLPDEGGRVIDVGSGAGLPGLVAAAMRPHMDFVLLEPRGRRVAFLRAAVRRMGLQNVQVREGRIEELTRDAGPEPSDDKFDHVVSRATFPYEKWLEKGRHLLKDDNSRIYAMLGPTDPDGLGKCEAELGLRMLHTYSCTLPDGSSRRVVVLNRVAR